MRHWILLAALTCTGACDKPKPPNNRTPTASTSTANRIPIPTILSRVSAPDRVIALGDVHGDLKATRAALRLAQLIDEQDHWIGGSAALVQTGDILDRGDDEQAILELFERLQGEAKAAGGAVHLLNGNHELMNAMADFRYVTRGGFRDFEDAPKLPGVPPVLPSRLRQRLPPYMHARAEAFLPGGYYARQFAQWPVVLVVGDTVYAHGGVLPKHVAYGLDRMHQQVSAWLLGLQASPEWMRQPDNPVWSRHFADKPDADDCKLLSETLARLGVKRMVIGHTVQPRIRPACEGKVWRVDVGMAAAYGGQPEVLELRANSVQPIRSQD